MIIFPAIDLKDGKCVRLVQGKFDNVTVYGENPGETAKLWIKGGSSYIHVVDLDGAKDGAAKNAPAIKEIVNAAKGKAEVQLGGGIRSMEKADMAFSIGVSKIIIGTAAVLDEVFLKEALTKYKNKIIIGIDAKDGMAATHGWVKVSNTPAVELAKKAVAFGAETVIYTDIATDGMLKGPNLEAMEQMASGIDAKVIASGGVSGILDIKNLKKTGVYGVIVGKALYSGAFALEEAIVAAE